jgi:broad specificity phosphatase PhoE/shikimate kinase
MESISSLGDIQAVQLPDHAPSTSDDEDYTKVMSRKTSAIWGPKSMAIPTSQTGPVVEDDIHRYSGRSLVLVTVGLPARGKSHVSRKLCRYLNWIGMECRRFMAMSYGARHFEGKKGDVDYYSWDSDVLEDWKVVFQEICKDVRAFVKKPEQSAIAILDMHACTEESRQFIYSELRQTLDHDRIIFLEIVMDDSLCEQMVRLKVLTSPEYKDMDPKEGETLMNARIDDYKRHYQPVSDTYTYIRVVNNKRHTLNKIKGYLPARIVNWVLNAKVGRVNHPIYFFPPPENEYTLQDRIGGNPSLTAKGREEARAAFEYLNKIHPPGTLEVWTSKLNRSIQAAELFESSGYTMKRWLALNEIHTGACEGLTRAEIDEKFPFIDRLRKANKYHFRFPQGESYLDLVHRLERVILSLDRANAPVLVVAHRAVLRELFAYYYEEPADKPFQFKLPTHMLWKYIYQGEGPQQLQRVVLPTPMSAMSEIEIERLASTDCMGDLPIG